MPVPALKINTLILTWLVPWDFKTSGENLSHKKKRSAILIIVQFRAKYSGSVFTEEKVKTLPEYFRERRTHIVGGRERLPLLSIRIRVANLGT